MTQKQLFEMFSKRDYSGSPEDSYIQELETFFNNSYAQGKSEDFLSLLEQAERENKKIVVSPKFEEEMKEVFYEDIPFESLILV